MATKGKINVDFTMRYIGALRANRIVANPNRYSTINYKDIVTYAARAAHVPESSIEVAMDALYDALSYFVLNGHNVKIDGLGTFFFGINAFAEEQIENAGADAIYRLKIGYLPEKDLREAMNNVAVTTSYTNPSNLAVDNTVPAVIYDINSMQSQTASQMKEMNFGSVHEIPEGGLFIRVHGLRLSRVQVTGKYNLVGVADGQKVSADNGNLTISTVSVSANYLILKVDYPSFEPIEDVTDLTPYVDQLVFTDESGKQLSNLFFTSVGTFAIKEAWINATTPSAPYGERTFQKRLSGGGYIAVPQKETYKMIIQGAGLNEINTPLMAATLLFDPAKITVNEITQKSSTRIDFTFTPLESLLNIYTNPRKLVDCLGLQFAIGGSSVVVSSLSANGISVPNGGSSTVQAGQSYNFVFAGANLSNIKQSNLVVPSGATVSNFAASASQVSFRLTIGEAGGNIGINYNGASLFSVSVTIPTNISASITSIGGVANNGTLQVTPSSGRATVTVAGTGLDSLSASNFVMSGYTMSLNEGSATERQLTITGTNGFGGGTLRVQIDGTTIFTITISTGDEVSF